MSTQPKTPAQPSNSKTTYRFDVEPMPAPRLTHGQVQLLRIPRAQLPPDLQKVRDRVERYMNWKNSVKWEAKRLRFPAVLNKFHIEFFVHTDNPDLHLQPHQDRPDLDNMLKSFKDALFDRDEHIYSYWCKKVWTTEKSHIIVTI